MINKSELFKTAWKIAKTARKNFGGQVREYFSESLKQAWGEMKSGDILDMIKNHEAVEGYSSWKKHDKDRIYFNLHGYDNSKRGCRNFKLYYDNTTENLIMSRGRGVMSDQFHSGMMDVWNLFENHKNFKYFG